MNNSNGLLISEPPLQVIPSLAVALKSSDKAIMLQQIHYWLLRSKNIVDGHRWVFNTVKGWHEQFPWLAEKTVQRYLKDLCDRKLLITANYNKANFDRTKWYRINYDALDKLTYSKGTDSPNGEGLIVPLERDSLTQPIPIDYPETTHKNTNMVKSKNLTTKDYQQEFEKLWEQYPKYRKQGKQRACSSYTHWRKSSKDNTFEKAQEQLKKYLNHIKVQQVPTQFIKAAKTWFANIDDEYDQMPKQVNNNWRPQKSVEKGTDWSKQKFNSGKASVADTGELKDYFANLEKTNGIADSHESERDNR
ncbi:hypothetical protein [uncultured Lactobacillus sp.]|uniref:hypothetical protein n=1 Tax=uncultured Lactobacillus sp. TaxID=153152 RepID=UPI0025E04C69|nr:hypothetical protein [uncultured Lactobacillus sp.]